MRICWASSGEAIGLPDVSRRISGRNLSASSWSNVIIEAVSELAPLRSTMMLSGELVSFTVESRPATSAIAATKTATTRAMAPAVIELETRLSSRLRLLYLKGIAISVDDPERFGNRTSCRRSCREPGAQNTEHHRDGQRLRDHERRNPKRREWPQRVCIEREDLEDAKCSPAAQGPA